MFFFTKQKQTQPRCKRCIKQNFSVIVPDSILYPSQEDGRTYYWHLVNKTPDMGDLDLIESFRLVFEQLDPLFQPLRFDSTSDINRAQIFIRFAVDGDPNLPEPFGEGVLAYAFAPTDGWAGKMYVNDAWNWAKMHSDAEQKLSLPLVLTHEILHLFNLGHSEFAADLMYPTYNPYATITQDTRSGIDLLYGELKKSLIEQEEVADYLQLFRDLFPNIKELSRLTEPQLVVLGKHLKLNVSVDDLKRDTVAKILEVLL